MSICVVDGKQCMCQPEDGTPCPGVVGLRTRIAEMEAALRTIIREVSGCGPKCSGEFKRMALDSVSDIALRGLSLNRDGCKYMSCVDQTACRLAGKCTRWGDV